MWRKPTLSVFRLLTTNEAFRRGRHVPYHSRACDIDAARCSTRYRAVGEPAHLFAPMVSEAHAARQPGYVCEGCYRGSTTTRRWRHTITRCADRVVAPARDAGPPLANSPSLWTSTLARQE